ncbi:hypothetical protein [Streptomyces roseolus]|uniref:hypothetical protein n=1 Tax=Streptomyces roseolus TaxID=67358 RepID=UPI0037943290
MSPQDRSSAAREGLAGVLADIGVAHQIDEHADGLLLSLLEVDLHHVGPYIGRYLVDVPQDVRTPLVVRFPLTQSTARTVAAAGRARLLAQSRGASKTMPRA